LSDPLDWLFGLEQFGIKFGLHNISVLVDALGRPDRAFKSVHIAGTNGKGSVAAMVDTALRSAGHRAGRYTSPHLVDLTERFVIDGRPVAKQSLRQVVGDVRLLVDRLRARGELDVHPTFFEVATAASFELFRREAVDVAVCEVGLGGRLDATNVLTPVVCAITSIGFDHEQYLGRTLREIAAEKAGIVKPGVPVVVGPIDKEAADAIAAVALDRNAPLVPATLGEYAGTPLALRGRHQADNAAAAATILETLDRQGCTVPASAIADGLAHTVWPGRLDLRRLPDGREVLLDAAHNPAGAAALAEYLRSSSFANAPLVFGAMRDKDIRGMLAALMPVVGDLIVTRASNARAIDPVELATLARSISPERSVVIAPSAAAALTTAWSKARRSIVAGSIFLLGDVMKDAGWS
jgi:dihydrofolate synthase/folylpolyglutamate synthase